MIAGALLVVGYSLGSSAGTGRYVERVVTLPPSTPAAATSPAATPAPTPTTTRAAVASLRSAPPLPTAPPYSTIPAGTVLPRPVVEQVRSARWSGNNAEAEDFARAVQELNAANLIGAWVHLDLLPSYSGTLSGSGLIEYRKSVISATLTMVLDASGLAEWGRTSPDVRALFLESSVNLLHTPPALIFGPIDYYPNATRASVTIADESGRVLALGTYALERGTVLKLAP